MNEEGLIKGAYYWIIPNDLYLDARLRSYFGGDQDYIETIKEDSKSWMPALYEDSHSWSIIGSDEGFPAEWVGGSILMDTPAKEE